VVEESRRLVEYPASFGRAATLAGIVTLPPPGTAQRDEAVLLLNAGLLHRIGPNRVYVKLARRLAEHGFVVMRFDFSGIGDSLPRTDNLPIEQAAVLETREAMDCLAAGTAVERFVLAGICSGADVASRVAGADPRVSSLVLINGGGLDAEALARYAPTARSRIQRRYYRRKMFDLRSWKRLLTGKSHLRGIARSMLGTIRLGPQAGSPTPAGGAGAGGEHPVDPGVDCLFILSEGSIALDLFRMVMGEEALQSKDSKIRAEVVAGVDHVFTPLWSQDLLLDRVCGWLAARDSATRPGSLERERTLRSR